jgi:glycosyltransferase involved in cell wall biosynthesis
MRLLYFTRRYTNHDARWLRTLAVPGGELAFLSLEKVDSDRLSRVHRTVTFLASPELAPVASTAALHGAETAVRLEWERWSPEVVMAGPLTDAGYLATQIDAKRTLLVSWAFDVLEEPQTDLEARHRLEMTLGRAQGLLADCDAIAQQCEKLGSRSFPVRCVLPWGLSMEDRPVASRGRRQAGPQRSAFVFFNTRGFEPVQQPLLLLEAFRRAWGQRADLQLWLAGQGSLREKAEAFVAEHGLTSAVRFVGYLGAAELGALFHEVDAYVACARSDGSSLSLLQAMYAGLPCITADLASNREWIDDRGGWLAPVNDAGAFASAMLMCAGSPRVKRDRVAEFNRRRVSQRADLSANLPRLWSALAQLKQRSASLQPVS